MQSIIDALKALTVKQDAQFSQAAEYFLDHIAENPQFLKEGKVLKGKTDFYLNLLKPLMARLQVTVDTRCLTLLRLKKYRFIHGGAFLIPSKHLAFYFFEDIQVGLAIISSLEGVTDFFRLSLFNTEKPIALGHTLSAPSQTVH